MDTLRRPVQGRFLNNDDVVFIRGLLSEHPSWSRNRIATALAEAWNWRTATGQLKNFAASTLLLKLEKRRLICLPARRQTPTVHLIRPLALDLPWPLPESITSTLSELQPLSMEVLSPRERRYRVLAHYLVSHHYLGFRRNVGESIAYLIRDRAQRDVACALFGAAAWRVKARDRFIGWEDVARAKKLNWITNNVRLLILPWVHVPHLASHILGRLTRRLASDWQAKYAHPVHAVETFVDRSRFRGTCYRAANWICVGQTQGRSRQDKDHSLHVPVKDVYVYPLTADFREHLCDG